MTGEHDLSAALEDAEGRALVQEILDRKEARNIRDRFFEQMVWGDVHTDGHGNVIPRPEPEHWAAIRKTYVSGRGHGKIARQQAAMEGSRTAIAWLDEHVRDLVNAWHHPHQEVWDLVARTDLTPPAAIVPNIASVRWICKAPTESVYAPGTNGWLMEQVLARITPAQREYNRKLAKENAAVMDRFAKLLGVKPHGADD